MTRRAAWSPRPRVAHVRRGRRSGPSRARGRESFGQNHTHPAIAFLDDVAPVINADAMMSGKLALAFVLNYGVSLAEAIIPAANVEIRDGVGHENSFLFGRARAHEAS